MTYSALSQHRTYDRSTIKPVVLTPDVIYRKVLLLSIAALLGLLYLTVVTRTNSLGYQVNNQSEKLAELKSENDDLTVIAAQSQNLDRVANSDVAQSMAPVTPEDTL